MPGLDSQFIEIVGTNLKLKDDVSVDYDEKDSLSFYIRATDPRGLIFDKQFHIIVNEFNEKPLSITIDNRIVENSFGSHIANITGVDTDGDNLTYSILSVRDYETLEIDGSVIKFKDGLSGDYEYDNVLNIYLRATDPDGLYV